jgi:hypothetical protein
MDRVSGYNSDDRLLSPAGKAHPQSDIFLGLSRGSTLLTANCEALIGSAWILYRKLQ